MKRVLIAAVVAMAMLACLAPAAQAAFGVTSFSGEVARTDGSPETQAGAHPGIAVATVKFNNHVDPVFGVNVPDGDIQNVAVELPPGFVGNPQSLPKCDEDVLQTTLELACPTSTQVGIAVTDISFWGPFYSKIYNMVPPPGEPAQFAMQVSGVVVHFDAKVRSDGDYGLTVDISDISQKTGVNESRVEFWGVPADQSHDALRGQCVGAGGPTGNLCPSEAPAHPFLTNPTYCSGQRLTTRLRTNPWTEPDNVVTASFDEDVNGVPMIIEGCDRVPFDPGVEAAPVTTAPDKPTGYTFDLSMPQEDGVGGIAEGHLRKAVVSLPDGMTVNPASAGGLGACTDAQVALKSTAPAECPNASKIGSVRIETPLLAEPLSGALFLGTQQSDDPESGQMFRLFLVVEGQGVTVKLPGQVRANRETGNLTASFDDNPQLPFSLLHLELKDGPRAPLATPSSCGEKWTTAELTSWSGKTRVVRSGFTIPCGAKPGFKPTMIAGSDSPLGGAHSAFSAEFTKADGEADITGLKLLLPEGLTASLTGNLGTQIGSAEVFAGPGPSPLGITGRVYLEGPYGDAPYSLKTVVPAVAGPFDLGEVVVRQKIYVNPITAQVTAVSDPLPTIVKGVPVRMQRLDVHIDKPGFMLNPTSCDPMDVKGTLGSSAGESADVSSRFQLTNCERLAFKPSLKLKVSGATKRGKYPKLRAELRAPEGQANIGKVSVALPHSEFLAQEHIKTICTRVQYAANGGGGKACPPGSVYGWARAFTPLLDQPLEGPVFLRSSSNPLPDLVASLDGQIHIDLSGRIDSVNGGIRNTFESVPDAPVTKFVLSMKGGKKSLLVNSRNLCAGKNRATVKMDGQNGKVHDFRPVVGNSCKGKARKGKK